MTGDIMTYMCFCGKKFVDMDKVRIHVKNSHSHGSLKYLMEKVINLDSIVETVKK